MEGYWEHFQHSADIGIRGYGLTMGESFRQAALALTAVVVDPRRIPSKLDVAITCDQAPDREVLFYDWLNALVFEMATRHVLFGDYLVEIDGMVLRAKASGATMEDVADDFGPEIKGATFTELKVQQNVAGWWVAQCVLDV